MDIDKKPHPPQALPAASQHAPGERGWLVYSSDDVSTADMIGGPSQAMHNMVNGETHPPLPCMPLSPTWQAANTVKAMGTISMIRTPKMTANRKICVESKAGQFAS